VKAIKQYFTEVLAVCSSSAVSQNAISAQLQLELGRETALIAYRFAMKCFYTSF